MSLNFSDDEETYETKIAEEENKYEGHEKNESSFDTELKYGERREGEMGEEGEGEMEEGEGEGEGEAEMEEVVPEKKKKKTSVGFHLKNIFNEVALNRIHRYMKKKRKSDCLQRGEEFFDEATSEDSDEGEKTKEDDVDDIEKYAREEQKRLAQMIPEKDEFWELYIYLNLKKKKRKIEYDPSYYNNAFKKILESVKKEYIRIIEEQLFKNEKLQEYFITPDITNVVGNLETNIFQIEKFLKARVIKKGYELFEINRRLIDLFNKGRNCNYIKEMNIYSSDDKSFENSGNKEESYWDEEHSNKGIDQQKEKEREREKEKENRDNEFHRSLSSSVYIEKEKLNVSLKNMYDKYVHIINKVKRHQRNELRSNFNIFMNLINEATSKLYFNINNVLVTDENVNMTDIYKTIRRKYNMHDVLAKIQKLTQKREVYEEYRSYLLYKYKTTFRMCEDAFKNHIMQDNVNIFNFKNLYNTNFAMDVESIIKTVKKEKSFNEEEEEEEDKEDEEVDDDERKHREAYGMKTEKELEKGLKGEFNKQRKYPVDESYKNDMYTDEFFNINSNNGKRWEGNTMKTVSKKMEAQNSNENASSKYENEKKVNVDKSSVAQSSVKMSETGEPEKPKEETPLERAKRIAGEKRKKLLMEKLKIL